MTLFLLSVCLDTTPFGLVVGFNGSDDPKTEPLRYADDDAVQNALLLADLGGQYVLLVEADDDTRKLHPDISATEPTMSALELARDKLNLAMAKARQAGESPVLFFFYSGHGDVEHNEGYVQLADGRLWRHDLHALLASFQADRIHVVIDACKSYFLVFDRGAGGERRAVQWDFVSTEPLAEHIGVFLSVSAAQDSHEWEAYQSGVFSHQLRSALRGAADADGDLRITYDEAAAFVYTANHAIKNPRFRPEFLARAPVADETLLEREAAGDALVVGPGVAQHLYLESMSGVRLLDVHPLAAAVTTLALPRERPLYVHDPKADAEYTVEVAGRVTLAELSSRPRTIRSRSALSHAFEQLFAEPFGPEAVAAYRSQRGDSPLSREASSRNSPHARAAQRMRPVVELSALGAFALGLTLNAWSYAQRNDVTQQTSQVARARINDELRARNQLSIGVHGVGVGLGLIDLLMRWWWPDPEVGVRTKHFTLFAPEKAQ